MGPKLGQQNWGASQKKITSLEVFLNAAIINPMYENLVEIKEELRGKVFLFHTRPGVFSKGAVDQGSRLLIETMEIKPGDTVLDLGCGYGPIGIVAADLAIQGKVMLVDANLRAVRLAEENIKMNSINNAKALLSDGLEAVADQQFTVILSNPPASSGIEIFEEFCQDSFNCLKPTGKLYFVTQGRLKEAVKRVFQKVFGNYEIAGRNAKYLVSLAVKK